MKNKSFTLMELLIAVVMIGILGTLSIPFYQKAIENSKAKACATNQEVLKTALDIYAMENDAMPASLAKLSPKYIEKSYAKVMKAPGSWKAKLAYFIVENHEKNFAYAASFLKGLAKGNMSLLTCPNDANPSAEFGSYGINAALASKSAREYNQLSADTLVIGDCANATFTTSSELVKRHKIKKILAASINFANGVYKGAKRPIPIGDDSCTNSCLSAYKQCLANSTGTVVIQPITPNANISLDQTVAGKVTTTNTDIISPERDASETCYKTEQACIENCR